MSHGENRDSWRTYTVAQNEQVRGCLRSLLGKLDDDRALKVAERLIHRLSSQTHDWQLVPLSTEEDEILSSVEHGLWGTATEG